MIPFLKNIFINNPSLNILIYSGDVDIGEVPMPTTLCCLHELSDVVNNEKYWSSWKINNWHVGFYEVYDR